jgi:excisionase family DNA binding protein
MPDLKEVIPTEEAAERHRYHLDYMCCMMREGSTEGVKIGRTWMIKRAALDRYMKRAASMAKHDPRRSK